MDKVLYTQLMTIIATIKKIQNDLKDNALSVTTLKSENKKDIQLQKEVTDKLNKDIKDNVSNLKRDLDKNITNLIKKIEQINNKFDKIDISTEITDKLKNYATNEALQSVLNDLNKSISMITLKEGKQGKNGIDGRNGIDGKNGQDGRDGRDGKDGKTPVFEVVETETVPAGENADAEIERENENYKLKFKIPKGMTIKGAQGRQGETGKDGKDGLTTSVNGVEQENGNITLTTDDIYPSNKNGTVNRTDNMITSVVKTGGKTLTPTRDSNGLISSITDGTRTWTFTRNASRFIESWVVS